MSLSDGEHFAGMPPLVAAPTESTAEVLQRLWDRLADEFADDVYRYCDHTGDAEEFRADRHKAADVWLSLEQCWPCDNDPGTNFTYGQLFGITQVAQALGVEVEIRFPEQTITERHGY